MTGTFMTFNRGAAAAREIAAAFPDKNGSGAVHCCVSDTPSNFNKTARVFLGGELEIKAERVEIEKY